METGNIEFHQGGLPPESEQPFAPLVEETQRLTNLQLADLRGAVPNFADAIQNGLPITPIMLAQAENPQGNRPPSTPEISAEKIELPPEDQLVFVNEIGPLNYLRSGTKAERAEAAKPENMLEPHDIARMIRRLRQISDTMILDGKTLLKVTLEAMGVAGITPDGTMYLHETDITKVENRDEKIKEKLKPGTPEYTKFVAEMAVFQQKQLGLLTVLGKIDVLEGKIAYRQERIKVTSLALEKIKVPGNEYQKTDKRSKEELIRVGTADIKKKTKEIKEMNEALAVLVPASKKTKEDPSQMPIIAEEIALTNLLVERMGEADNNLRRSLAVLDEKIRRQTKDSDDLGQTSTAQAVPASVSAENFPELTGQENWTMPPEVAEALRTHLIKQGKQALEKFLENIQTVEGGRPIKESSTKFRTRFASIARDLMGDKADKSNFPGEEYENWRNMDTQQRELVWKLKAVQWANHTMETFRDGNYYDWTVQEVIDTMDYYLNPILFKDK